MSKRERRERKKAHRRAKRGAEERLLFEPSGDVLVRCLACGLIQPQHTGDCRGCGHPYGEYAPDDLGSDVGGAKP